MKKVNPQFNTGLILSNIPATQYIAGEFSPFIGGNRVDVPDFWTSYLPVPEVQNANGFDEMNCTIRATLNCLETDYKFQTGLPIDWNDRHVSKTSNNTKNGNYIYKPIEAVADFGMVFEIDYPNQASSWEEYYQELPANLPPKARHILDKYEFNKEFIIQIGDKDFIYNKLKEAPLGVTVRYDCAEDPKTILNPSGNQNHMVMVYGAKYGEYWEIFDHYEWQRGKGVTKRYAWSYNFQNILRFFLISKDNKYMFKQNFPYLLVEGNEQKLGFFLDNKMYEDKDWAKVMVQSASRLKKYEPAIPVTLKDWNSCPHVNLKGEPI